MSKDLKTRPLWGGESNPVHREILNLHAHPIVNMYIEPIVVDEGGPIAMVVIRNVEHNKVESSFFLTPGLARRIRDAMNRFIKETDAIMAPIIAPPKSINSEVDNSDIILRERAMQHYLEVGDRVFIVSNIPFQHRFSSSPILGTVSARNGSYIYVSIDAGGVAEFYPNELRIKETASGQDLSSVSDKLELF